MTTDGSAFTCSSQRSRSSRAANQFALFCGFECAKADFFCAMAEVTEKLFCEPLFAGGRHIRIKPDVRVAESVTTMKPILSSDEPLFARRGKFFGQFFGRGNGMRTYIGRVAIVRSSGSGPLSDVLIRG